MEEAKQWDLQRKVVHIIDREADSLGRLRSWNAAGHLFLVRCDDRRVLWNGEPYLLSEIVEHFDSEMRYESVGEARYRGKVVTQEVAETEVILHRRHSAVIDGKKRQVGGEQLPIRLVMTRMLDEQGYMSLLTITELLTETDIDIGQLKRIAKNALPFKSPI